LNYNPGFFDSKNHYRQAGVVIANVPTKASIDASNEDITLFPYLIFSLSFKIVGIIPCRYFTTFCPTIGDFGLKVSFSGMK